MFLSDTIKASQVDRKMKKAEILRHTQTAESLWRKVNESHHVELTNCYHQLMSIMSHDTWRLGLAITIATKPFHSMILVSDKQTTTGPTSGPTSVSWSSTV